jgi:hypothetical protein
MATSTINTIKTTHFYQKLPELTWTASGSGKYFAHLGEVSSDQEIIAISIKDWGFLRTGDVIQPVMNGRKVDVLSNVNTCASANSYIDVMVVYR